MIRWMIAMLLLATQWAAAEGITVLAAASTKDALQEVASNFQKETGVEVKISPGGSNALAQQIINGAPAHLFVSASQEWMDAVDKEGLLAEQTALLGNQLVIVTPEEKKSITSPADLLHGDVKHVALAGEKVPAGIYAQQALTFHKLYEALLSAGRIVRGTDVRATLAYVERGEADAAIVYATDARIAGNVRVAYTFSPESHEKIVYPAGLLKAAANVPDAGRFYTYLRSPAAAEVFEKHGFTMLDAER